MRLAFLHILLCASCFLAFAQQDREVSPGLQPGDQVRIRPGANSQGPSRPLNFDLTVNGDGRLSVHGFGLDLDVLGLQAPDAATLIQAGLREASGSPGLNVTVLSSRNGLPLPEQSCLTIGGQVHEPGQIAFRHGITLTDAVEAAGGATAGGATGRIKLYREGDLRTYDLANPEHAALRLCRNDILEVPDKPWVGR